MIADAPVIDAAVRVMRDDNTERLLWSRIGESATDIAVFHTPPLRPTAERGRSDPSGVGLELMRLAGPERVRLMVSPCDPAALARSVEELDELIELGNVCGLSLHVDEIGVGLGDVVLALIEHARSRGLEAVAFHSAVDSTEHGQRHVVGEAIRSFPDVSFEVSAVSGLVGETGRNVYLDLADLVALLGREPRRFAEILGELLGGGSVDPATANRILWATGATALHPQALLERFWALEMPEDLVARRGYPDLTDGLKRKILAGNYAQKAGLDLEAAMSAIPNDHMRRAQMAGDYAKPWSTATPATMAWRAP